jgi:hypothetical protein
MEQIVTYKISKVIIIHGTSSTDELNYHKWVMLSLIKFYK